MKTSLLRHLLFMLLLVPVACSDEEALPEAPDTHDEPIKIFRQSLSYNTLCTEEKLDSDAQTVTAKQTFSCTDGLLTQMVYEQSFAAVEPVSISHTSNINYLEDKVVITDSNGCINTYLLNPFGYADSCVREENGVVKRRYCFYYNANLLSAIEEYLPADNFETAYSCIVIKRNDDNLQIAHQVGESFQTFKATFNLVTPQNNFDIPCPFLAELHPLSMHTPALYAQILGDTFPFFLHQITPEENAESQETTTINYNINDAGIPTDCFIQTTSYGETFNRKISYQID